MQTRLQRYLRVVAGLLASVLMMSSPLMGAESVQLKPGHPDRYTVREGDTLWGIADRFVEHPWQWPVIWQGNQQVENPHLIYPGDVLVLTFEGGGPRVKLLRSRTVKLEPAIYAEPLRDPIPTIPPDAIRPFLTRPLVITEDELKDSPYVTVGLDDKIVLGKGSLFYARGFDSADGDTMDGAAVNGSEALRGLYKVFRPGDAFVHPDTAENLGYSTLYLGGAKMLQPGDPAKLQVVESTQEIEPTDRLVPAGEADIVPYFMPQAPAEELHGYIIDAPGGVSEVGQLSVVVITLGEREGLVPGHVLRIMRHSGKHRDPVTGKYYDLPDEDSGLAMVFRTFEKVSYALVMKATRSVHIMDTVETP